MTKSILTDEPSTVVSGWFFVQDKLDALAAVAFLVARLYIAKIFFYSGLSKIKDWGTTLYLFREEYQVPLVSPEVAAVMGTAGELGLAVLLAIGLFTRFAACGLFVLNIVAFASYYDALKDSPAAIQDHIEWGILLALLLTAQVQKLTVDDLVKWKRQAS
jgi:putative oxidoreductase